MVKRSRLQSQLAPSRTIWRLMVSPYCSFHCHARSRNFSRPISRRLIPSFSSWRFTIISVEMLA